MQNMRYVVGFSVLMLLTVLGFEELRSSTKVEPTSNDRGSVSGILSAEISGRERDHSSSSPRAQSYDFEVEKLSENLEPFIVNSSLVRRNIFKFKPFPT